MNRSFIPSAKPKQAILHDNLFSSFLLYISNVLFHDYRRMPSPAAEKNVFLKKSGQGEALEKFRSRKTQTGHGWKSFLFNNCRSSLAWTQGTVYLRQ